MLAMRQHFDSQPPFQIIPIERIVLPAHSRDQLPPLLAGLQWIWLHPALRAQIFQLLERVVLAGKKDTGRPGMDLWQILVLGVVRLGLEALAGQKSNPKIVLIHDAARLFVSDTLTVEAPAPVTSPVIVITPDCDSVRTPSQEPV